MVNSNRGRITYILRIAGYFRVYRLKIAIFTHDIVIVDPLAEENAQRQRNLCIADSTGLSSIVLPLLPLKSAKSREITMPEICAADSVCLSLLVFTQLLSEVARCQAAKPARKQILARNSQSRSFKVILLGSPERRQGTK